MYFSAAGNFNMDSGGFQENTTLSNTIPIRYKELENCDADLNNNCNSNGNKQSQWKEITR